MAEGFVYLLLNPSFPDQVKFGLTRGSSDRRAKELWTTGVPTPFIVIYDELVSDAIEVERRLHGRFAGYRVHPRREFFRVPIPEAVRALQKESLPFKLHDAALGNRISILSEVRTLYLPHLRPGIIDAAIVQSREVCFLEVTRRLYQHSHDQVVERADLSHFVDGADRSLFPAEDSVEENARRFIRELDAYDLIMTAMPLFTEDEAYRIAAEWEKPGGKLELLRADRSKD